MCTCRGPVRTHPDPHVYPRRTLCRAIATPVMVIHDGLCGGLRMGRSLPEGTRTITRDSGAVCARQMLSSTGASLGALGGLEHPPERPEPRRAPSAAS